MSMYDFKTPAPARRRPSHPSLVWLAPLLVGLGVGMIGYRILSCHGAPAGKVESEPRAITPAGELAADEKATIGLFKRISPSVVYITTLSQRINPWTRNVTEIPAGTGSGFVWDEAGHIVTNYHVVRGASGAKVTLSDHTTHDAELVGAAPNFDLAVLRIKVPAEKLSRLPAVGRSNDLQVGQKVYAIGNPFGLDQTLTTGIVSALGRTIQGVSGQPIEDAIQTDAAINPGNSGGPLLDSSGRLIGINTAIYSPSGASAGIGFAVPVDTVNRIVPQLISNGKVARPRFGANFFDDRVNLSLMRRLGVAGVLVKDVEENSPAATAGLKPTTQVQGRITIGDVILQFNGKDVQRADDINALLERYQPGTAIKLKVLREGEARELSVTLGEVAK